MKKMILAALLALGITNVNAAGYMDVIGCDGIPFYTIAITDNGMMVMATMDTFVTNFEAGAVAAEAWYQAKEQGTLMEFNLKKLVPEVCKDARKEG